MATIAELRAKFNLDTSGLDKGIQKAKSGIAGLSSSFIGQAAKMAVAFAGVSLVKSMVMLGVSAEETADKFSSVFGTATDEMNDKIEKLKDVIPATTKELQDAVAVFGLMAQSFGLNDKAAENFSINMAKIAGDLSSFHDIAPEVAFDKLRAGIAGSSEPLQALGIDIREAALKQEALNIGIYDGVGVLSTSQKAMAIQSAVVTQMGAASGNAALTMDSAANQIKFLTRGFKELGTTIGTATLPVIQDFIRGLGMMRDAGSWTWGKMFPPSAAAPIKQVAMDFREMAIQGLDARGALEETSKSLKTLGENNAITMLFKDLGSSVDFIDKDFDSIAKNEALIAARAAELRAEYEKLSPEVREIMEKTGTTADNAQQIADANEKLRLSIEEQIKAQGIFEAQQKIITQDTKTLTDLRLQLMEAELAGNSQLITDSANQLEIELLIQKIMKDTNVEREQATVFANEIYEATSNLKDLKLAAYEAEASGNTALIDQANIELETEALIQKIMKETNISRTEAVELSLGLLAASNANLKIKALEQEIVNANLTNQKWLAEEKTKELNKEKDILKIIEKTGKTREEATIFEETVTDEQREQLGLSEKIEKSKKVQNDLTEEQIKLLKQANNVKSTGGDEKPKEEGKTRRVVKRRMDREAVGRGMSKDEILLAIMRQEAKVSRIVSGEAKNKSRGLRGFKQDLKRPYQENIVDLKAALGRLEKLDRMKEFDQKMDDFESGKLFSDRRKEKEEKQSQMSQQTNSYLKSIDGRISSITNSLS